MPIATTLYKSRPISYPYSAVAGGVDRRARLLLFRTVIPGAYLSLSKSRQHRAPAPPSFSSVFGTGLRTAKHTQMLVESTTRSSLTSRSSHHYPRQVGLRTALTAMLDRQCNAIAGRWNASLIASSTSYSARDARPCSDKLQGAGHDNDFLSLHSYRIFPSPPSHTACPISPSFSLTEAADSESFDKFSARHRRFGVGRRSYCHRGAHFALRRRWPHYQVTCGL